MLSSSWCYGYEAVCAVSAGLTLSPLQVCGWSDQPRANPHVWAHAVACVPGERLPAPGWNWEPPGGSRNGKVIHRSQWQKAQMCKRIRSQFYASCPPWAPCRQTFVSHLFAVPTYSILGFNDNKIKKKKRSMISSVKRGWIWAAARHSYLSGTSMQVQLVCALNFLKERLCMAAVAHLFLNLVLNTLPRNLNVHLRIVGCIVNTISTSCNWGWFHIVSSLLKYVDNTWIFGS